MDKKVLLCLCLCLWLVPGVESFIHAQAVLFEKPLSPRIANYDIEVILDVEEKILRGREILRWQNTSQNDLAELQFHLYLNAFRNNQSTFMIESGGSPGGETIPEDGWGFSEIARIVLLPDLTPGEMRRLVQRPSDDARNIPGRDLTRTLRFIQPDTPEHVHDRTVLKINLPEPLPPGESLRMYIDFTAKLPQPPITRSGAKEEFFFVAQWFPKIGVYSDRGWNCHQYHYNSEFFADFGVYDVRITLPEEYIVGATGVEVSVESNGDGTKTHAYHAEDVHDFAWTASPEFLEFKGKSQDVNIRVLMQPDHEDQGPRHVEAAKAAVEYLQNWYGDYPYPNLTVVDPRRGAENVGGSEYPTLFSVGTHYGFPEGIRVIESIIFHEFAHNYWQNMVASNEFEESWLDEGLTTYTEFQMMNEHYGQRNNLVDFLGLELSISQGRRFEYIMSPDDDPMLKKSWEYYSRVSYVINSYSRPSLLLTSLHNNVGRETMHKILSTYLERWRFRHPQSRDFVKVVNEVTGKDFSAFFNQAFYSTAVMDYSVDQVFSRERRPAKGYDYHLSSFDSLSASPEGAETEGVEEPADSLQTELSQSGEESPLYYSGANIRRLGEFKFPVEIEIVFEDGESIREQWDGQGYWKKFRYLKPSPLVSATVDPANKLVMDINFTNNSKAVDTPRLGVNKLAIRWLFWMQFLMDQPEIFNLFSFF